MYIISVDKYINDAPGRPCKAKGLVQRILVLRVGAELRLVV